MAKTNTIIEYSEAETAAIKNGFDTPELIKAFIAGVDLVAIIIRPGSYDNDGNPIVE